MRVLDNSSDMIVLMFSQLVRNYRSLGKFVWAVLPSSRECNAEAARSQMKDDDCLFGHIVSQAGTRSPVGLEGTCGSEWGSRVLSCGMRGLCTQPHVGPSRRH